MLIWSIEEETKTLGELPNCVLTVPIISLLYRLQHQLHKRFLLFSFNATLTAIKIPSISMSGI